MNSHFKPPGEPLPEEPPIVRLMKGMIAQNEALLARIERRLRFGWFLLGYTVALLGLNIGVMIATGYFLQK